MTSKLYAVVLVAMLASVAVIASACSLGTHDQWGFYKVENKHYSIDGRTIRCFLIRTSKGTSSLSCDWDHPSP